MEKTDCFAYINKKGHKDCYCLKSLYCKDKKCNFYKNKRIINIEEIEEDINQYVSTKK